MIKNNILVRLMRIKLILDEIQSGKFPSIRDLQDRIEKWQDSISLMSDDINGATSERTIKRDIKDIRQIFLVDIDYSKIKRGYYVQNSQSSPSDEATRGLLDDIQLYFLIMNTPNADNYIRFSPRKAKGTEHLYLVLDAIRKKKQLNFDYHQYEKGETKQRTVSPLGLKEFKGFWYLIATDNGKSIKTFGLDRIDDLNEVAINAVSPNNFDIDEYYKDCYGIVRMPGMEVQEIKIKVTPIKAKYYKANPLHHSQKEIEETKDYTTFSYKMYLTYDLLQELRSHGKSQVEVIQPKGALDEEI